MKPHLKTKIKRAFGTMSSEATSNATSAYFIYFKMGNKNLTSNNSCLS